MLMVYSAESRDGNTLKNAIVFLSLLMFGLNALTLQEATAKDEETYGASEIQVTADEIIDAEYDQENARFTFTDRNRNLWIGNVDPLTGDFLPPNGRAILVDTNAAFVTDFGNGPEWLFSNQGAEIVYTKYLPDQPLLSKNANIAKAALSGGNWVGDFLSTSGGRSSPIGSLDKYDTNPRIHYQGVIGSTFYWSGSDDLTLEEKVPDSSKMVGGNRRWVPEMSAIIFTAEVEDTNGNATPQVFLYHTDTRILEQLTSDDGGKEEAYMWKAPEHNNEYVFFVMIDRTKLRVYRKIDTNGEGLYKWTAINTIDAPKAMPYIWSPEPFTHNGKSYIFLVLSASESPYSMLAPSQIGLTSIDSKLAGIRFLTSNSEIKRVRMDPEVFITSESPYIYYNRYFPATAKSAPVQDGVWRVDTGLGPALVP